MSQYPTSLNTSCWWQEIFQPTSCLGHATCACSLKVFHPALAGSGPSFVLILFKLLVASDTCSHALQRSFLSGFLLRPSFPDQFPLAQECDNSLMLLTLSFSWVPKACLFHSLFPLPLSSLVTLEKKMASSITFTVTAKNIPLCSGSAFVVVFKMSYLHGF